MLCSSCAAVYVSGMKRMRKFLHRPMIAIATYIAVTLLMGFAAYYLATGIAGRQAVAMIEQHAAETLDLQQKTTLGHFEKYRHLPPMMGRREDVRNLANQISSSAPTLELKEAAKRIANDVTTLSGAIDTAVALPDGTVFASSTGFLETQMIADSQLLAAPLEGRLGRSSISGSNGRRAYAFSSPVRVDGIIRAILIVAAPLESIQRTWALSENPIFALNNAGQTLVANLVAPSLIESVRLAMLKSGGNLLVSEDVFSDGKFLLYGREILILNWWLYTLEPTGAVVAARRNAGVIAMLVTILVAFTGAVFLWRMFEARRRRRQEAALALRLERRVRDRTLELTDTNAKLEVEVDERRTAEAALTKAQGELVQSAKLAAIGQMSAALAHEYNQPLAAIRTYSDNANKFLSKGNNGQVEENLSRISSLVERMATLSKTLKSFARRPRSEIGMVDLAETLRDAFLLVDHQAKAAQVKIIKPDLPAGITVKGGPVRLSQVFVNLLSNAVDACAGQKNACIEVRIEEFPNAREDEVLISVGDNGSGINPDVVSSIFDPFYTTKDVGEGLGLGLSIAYNIVHDFGGRLEATNHEDGGAVLSVTLKRANSSAMAAE